MDDLSRCRFRVFRRGFVGPSFAFLRIVAAAQVEASVGKNAKTTFVIPGRAKRGEASVLGVKLAEEQLAAMGDPER